MVLSSHDVRVNIFSINITIFPLKIHAVGKSTVCRSEVPWLEAGGGQWLHISNTLWVGAGPLTYDGFNL